jgi:hypothetical protein
MDKLSGAHAGDWRWHHISLPEGPGDFTPVKRPDYHEETITPLDALWELLGVQAAGIFGERGLPELEAEAG